MTYAPGPSDTARSVVVILITCDSLQYAGSFPINMATHTHQDF